MEKAYLKTLARNLKSALGQRDWPLAQSALLQLQQVEPLSIQTRGFELELLIKQKHWQQARPLLEQLLVLFPQSPRIHFLAGHFHYHLQNYAKAIIEFRESHQYHPHWKTQRWIGKSLTQIGELDEAESVLLSVKNYSVLVLLDLAWLHERRQKPKIAMPFVADYLRIYPDDSYAQAQHLRLSSHVAEPQILIDDVEALLALDEAVPDEVLPQYIAGLLEGGKSGKVRQFIQQHQSKFSQSLRTELGWICHKNQAYDLVMILFLSVLEQHLYDFKLLNTLESAAKHCQQIDLVVEQYESFAPQHKPLYGRIKKLMR